MEMENKEYDLLDLLKWCWGVLLQYVCRPLLFLIRFGFKQWKVLAVAAVFGVALSFILPACFYKKYSGSVLVGNNVCHTNDFINAVTSLQLEDRQVLAHKLNVPFDSLYKLQKVAAHYVYSRDSVGTGYNVNYKDVEKYTIYPIKHNIFCLEVVATDSVFVREISEKVLDYISNEAYVKSANELRVSSIKRNIEVLKEEIVMMDSLRKIEYFEKSRRNIVSSSQSSAMLVQQQTRLMHSEIIDLNSRLASAEGVLQFNAEPLQIMAPLSVNAIPENHWTKTFIKYAIIMVVLAYVGSLVWSYKKEIISFIG